MLNLIFIYLIISQNIIIKQYIMHLNILFFILNINILTLISLNMNDEKTLHFILNYY